MTPHTIRLHGHWKLSEPEPGRTRHERPFGAPTLSTDEQVWLVGPGLAAQGSVMLNGQLLAFIAANEPFRIVLPQLHLRNLLQFDLHTSDLMPDLHLEIVDSEANGAT